MFDFILPILTDAAQAVVSILITVGLPAGLAYGFRVVQARTGIQISAAREERVTALAVQAATVMSQKYRGAYEKAGTDPERERVNEARRSGAVRKLIEDAKAEGADIAKVVAQKGAEDLVELGVGILKRQRGAAGAPGADVILGTTLEAPPGPPAPPRTPPQRVG